MKALVSSKMNMNIVFILNDLLNDVVKWVTSENDRKALTIGHGLIETM